MIALLAAALSLSDANGVQHRLADYRGKVVLVNFWASWCEPCMSELPSMEQLRARLGKKPFAILAVQMDGTARTAKDVAAKLGLRFPLLPDVDNHVTETWKVELLPTSFLVAPDGTVAWKHVGQLDWLAEVPRIEKLLKHARARGEEEGSPRAR